MSTCKNTSLCFKWFADPSRVTIYILTKKTILCLNYDELNASSQTTVPTVYFRCKLPWMVRSLNMPKYVQYNEHCHSDALQISFILIKLHLDHISSHMSPDRCNWMPLTLKKRRHAKFKDANIFLLIPKFHTNLSQNDCLCL